MKLSKTGLGLAVVMLLSAGALCAVKWDITEELLNTTIGDQFSVSLPVSGGVDGYGSTWGEPEIIGPVEIYQTKKAGSSAESPVGTQTDASPQEIVDTRVGESSPEIHTFKTTDSGTAFVIFRRDIPLPNKNQAKIFKIFIRGYV